VLRNTLIPVPKLPSRFYQACCRTPHKRKLAKSTVQRQSPACQTVLDAIGDLLADRRQLKQVFFDDKIVRLLGKFPIRSRLAP
jgi:hypothetical protein